MEPRWLMLAVSILVSTCCAINYAYAVLSDTLKDDFKFSQTQVDLIGTCGNLGQYFGLFAGLTYDRFGPRICLVVAGSLIFIGFGMLSLLLGGVIPNANLASIAFFYMLASQAQPWLDNAVLVTNINNFPKHIGLVVGIGKAFNGLGASVFSLMYSGVFAPHIVHYLAFLAIAPTVIALGSAAVTYIVPNSQKNRPTGIWRFVYSYIVAGLLMVYVTSVSITSATMDISTTGKTSAVALLLVFYIAYGILPLASDSKGLKKETEEYRKIDTESVSFRGQSHQSIIQEKESGGMDKDDPEISHNLNDEERKDDASKDDDSKDSQEDVDNPSELEPVLGTLSVWQAVRTIEFALLFAAITFLCGSALSLINNLSQLVEAYNIGVKDDSWTTVLVTIVALGSCTGRMGTGILAHNFKQRRKWALLLCLSSIIMTASFIVLSWVKEMKSLTGPCFFVGLAFGMLWACASPICLELYGLESLAGVIFSFPF